MKTDDDVIVDAQTSISNRGNRGNRVHRVGTLVAKENIADLSAEGGGDEQRMVAAKQVVEVHSALVDERGDAAGRV